MKNKFKFLATMLIGILLSTNVWGTDASLVIDKTTFTKTKSGDGYAPYNGTRAIDGINIYSNQVMIQANKVQFESNHGVLYNTTEMPGPITHIDLSYSNGEVLLYAGTAQNPSSSTDNKVSSGTTITGDKRWFTAKVSGGSTGTCSAITVYYKACDNTLATPSVTAVPGNQQVTLSWANIPNASKYQVNWNNGGWVDATSTLVKTGLTNNTTYTWSVKAIGDGTTYCDSETADGSSTPSTAHNITYYIGNVSATIPVAEGANLVASLPASPESCDPTGSNVFMGWTTSPIDDVVQEAPTMVASSVTVTGPGTYYAVFAQASGGGGEKSFDKVTSAPTDWCGKYLIVYEGGNVAMDGSLTTLDAVRNTRAVTISNNKIAYSQDMENMSFTVAYKTGSSTVYSLKSASGKYISGTTTNANAANGIKQADTDANYEISFSGIELQSKSKDQQMVMKYNDASDQNRFRFYKSGQKAVALYKLIGGASYSNYRTSCAPCETEVAITKGPETHGTFMLSRSGEHVCIDNDATIRVSNIIPAGHYSIGEVTTTNGEVSGPVDGKYTVTVTGDATIGVTFVEDAKALVTWKVGGTMVKEELVYVGQTTTAPADPTDMPTCANTFMGWSTETLVGEGNDAPDDLFSTTSPAITEDVTFNAVFAQGSGSGPVTYTKVTTISDGTYLMATGQANHWGSPTSPFAYAGVKNVYYGEKVAVSVSNNVISTKPDAAKELTITQGTGDDAAYFAIFDGTSYLSMTEKNKFTFVNEPKYEWELTENGYIHNKGTYDNYNTYMILFDDGNSGNYQTLQYFHPLRDKNEGENSGSWFYHAYLFKKEGGTTYSNYVTTCATYTVTWRSNDYQIRVDADKAPGTVLTAPTVDDVREVNTQAACNGHLVGWVPAASTNNPKVKQDTAPAGMVGQQVTVTEDVVYHAVYADVAGE